MTIKSTLSLLTFALSIIATPPAYSQLSSQWTQQRIYTSEQLTGFINDSSAYAYSARLLDMPDGTVLSYGYNGGDTFLRADSTPTLLFSPQLASQRGVVSNQWSNARVSTQAVAIATSGFGFGLPLENVYFSDERAMQQVWSNSTPTLPGYRVAQYALDNRDVSLMLRFGTTGVDQGLHLADWSDGNFNLLTNQPLRDPITDERIQGFSQFQKQGERYSFIGNSNSVAFPHQVALYHYESGNITRVFTEQDARSQGVTFSGLGMWNVYTHLGSDGNLLLSQVSYEYPEVLYSVIDGQIQTAARIGQTVSTPFWGDVTLDFIGYGVRDGHDVFFMGSFSNPNTDGSIPAFFLSKNGTLSFIRTFDNSDGYFTLDTFTGNAFTASIANNAADFALYRFSQSSAVPEPGSVALFASLGVMGLAYTRRRNNIALHKAKNSRTLRHFFSLLSISCILLLKSGHFATAQVPHSKNIVYRTADNAQIFGAVGDTTYFPFGVDYDSAGLYLSVYDQNLPYVALNNGSGWQTLLSPQLRPSGAVDTPFTRVYDMGGGRVLASQAPLGAPYLNQTYLVAGNSALPLAQNSPAPSAYAVFAASGRDGMQDQRLSFYASDEFSPAQSAFYNSNGGSAQRVASAPFFDPVSGKELLDIWDTQPYLDGVLFRASYADVGTYPRTYGLYTIQNHSLQRLFTLPELLPSSPQVPYSFTDPTVVSGSNILLTVENDNNGRNDLYYVNGNLEASRIKTYAETLEGMPGYIQNYQYALDGDAVALLYTMQADDGVNSRRYHVLMRYREGNYEVIERFGDNTGQSYVLNQFYRGNLLLTEQRYNLDYASRYENFVLHYTLSAPVPEPSALIYALVCVAGLAYTRRRRKNRSL